MLNFFDPGKWLATKRRGQERGKAKCEHNPPPCLRNEELNLAHAITGLDSQEKNARSEAVYRKLAAVADSRVRVPQIYVHVSAHALKFIWQTINKIREISTAIAGAVENSGRPQKRLPQASTVTLADKDQVAGNGLSASGE